MAMSLALRGIQLLVIFIFIFFVWDMELNAQMMLIFMIHILINAWGMQVAQFLLMELI